MPIQGLTEVHRLSRTGKIRLGIKKTTISRQTGKEVSYPVATDYFVCPPEVQKVYGEKPRRLDVIIPVEDDEVWCNQYYRQYSRTRGLVCKGDGVTCRRMIDVGAADGSVANRDTKEVAWVEGLPCAGKACDYYQRKMCQETMNLQFFLPKVDGIGVWQIDTGSVHSIMFVNDAATTIRATCGKVAWIPLTLTLEPTDVNNPEDGKKKTVYCMHLRHESSLIELMEASEKPRKEVLIARPAEDEAPMDRLLNAGTPEAMEELEGAAEDDTDDLFGEAPTTQPTTTQRAPNPPAVVRTPVSASKPPPVAPTTTGQAPATPPAAGSRDWMIATLPRIWKGNYEKTLVSWVNANMRGGSPLPLATKAGHVWEVLSEDERKTLTDHIKAMAEAA